MLEFLNDFFNVLKLYVNFLFSLQFLPGVSIGSVFLVASLLFIIVAAIWVRK